MLNEVPTVIYDLEGIPMRVIKVSKVFFKNRNEEGYILHIERAEKVTAISEFDLKYMDGKYILNRKIFKEIILV
ncbi:MAG: hypothetical protein KID00_06070 [Clostridium argentinense]|uniref:Uncharacterized protein n=1 Tax=Clostridium faecium TaxID=2762223 RepID=A0ABR8YWJ3_9CLOT|nr:MULTISPECIES: hypothetical protein [Clostridium]MBD8048595.1 hypothetical protein [Clostridium faecium]MBS5823414.1 hypothetical protein [Clostridium argentinense]MDU1348600.1 hypothetical protein [Clostridium argentinense]